MLKALNQLGDVGVEVIQASKQSTIESFEQLSPVLTELANSGDDFVNAFHVFLTYPFVDEVVGRDPQVARNLHMGDYTNLSIELDVTVEGDEGGTGSTDLPTVLDPGRDRRHTHEVPAQSGDLNSKPCKKVLANPQELLQLREECAKTKNREEGRLQAAQPDPRPADPAGTRPRRRPGRGRRPARHPRPAAGGLR